MSRAKKKHINALYYQDGRTGYWSARCGTWTYDRLEAKDFEKLPHREQCLLCRRLERVEKHAPPPRWSMPHVMRTLEEPDCRGDDACFFLVSLRDVDPFNVVESGPKAREWMFPEYHLSAGVACAELLRLLNFRLRGWMDYEVDVIDEQVVLVPNTGRIFLPRSAEQWDRVARINSLPATWAWLDDVVDDTLRCTLHGDEFPPGSTCPACMREVQRWRLQ